MVAAALLYPRDLPCVPASRMLCMHGWMQPSVTNRGCPSSRQVSTWWADRRAFRGQLPWQPGNQSLYVLSHSLRRCGGELTHMSKEGRTTLSLSCLLGPDHACWYACQHLDPFLQTFMRASLGESGKAATARTPVADARHPAAAALAQAHLPSCAAHERGPGAIVSAIMANIGEVRCGA